MNEPMPTTNVSSHRPDVGLMGLLARLSLPIVFLAVGVGAYFYLAVEPESPPTPPAEKQAIRTRVTSLTVEDYPVVITTNGIVQAHNEVALSAEVQGVVKQVSPALEVGAYFEAGEVLVELDDRDHRTALAVAEAAHLGAEAALALAKQNHDRNMQLFDKQVAITKAAIQQSFATQAQAEAQVDSAAAQVERAKRDLARTKIMAPFAGRVRIKSVGVGQSVGAGTPLAMVFAVDFAEVRLPISGSELQYLNLPELATDAPVDVELRDGVNKENTTVWAGKIVRTEGVLDENSLELFAIARIDDPFGRASGQQPLRIGQPVIGAITGKTLPQVVALPRSAVRQLDQVYLVDKEALTLSKRTIVPIWSNADHILVRDPAIQDGQLLATTSIVYAPEGAKIEIIPDIPLTATTSSGTPMAQQ